MGVIVENYAQGTTAGTFVVLTVLGVNWTKDGLSLKCIVK